MFSSDMGKIIELQGQYIDRVNRNAANLNKQLQFLVNIGEQIGGATTQGETNDHTTLIGELTKQDEAIATAMTAQKTKTDELKNSIQEIITSYVDLKTASGNSGKVVEELMTYLNTLKENNSTKLKDLKTFGEELTKHGIDDALAKSYSDATKGPPPPPPTTQQNTTNTTKPGNKTQQSSRNR
jgi:hypothetical protein